MYIFRRLNYAFSIYFLVQAFTYSFGLKIKEFFSRASTNKETVTPLLPRPQNATKTHQNLPK